MTASAGATRLAVILSHPTQYYSPWFRWLSANSALTFHVFYLWDFGVAARYDAKFGRTVQWDVDLTSGYDHEFVPNLASDPGTHHFAGLDNPTLLERLEMWQPDAVLLFGYKWRTHLRVIRWARRRRVPLLFRGDSHLLGRATLPLTKRWLLRLLYAQFAAFLPVGSANRDYFTTLGVPAAKLFLTPHAVDASRFDPAQADSRTQADALRNSLGLTPQTKVILYAGKLVPEKQPHALLRAFLELRDASAALVFVGEGSEKPVLQDAARTVAAGASVHFLPFANQSAMPARYLLADVFVLPSRGDYETWGLAVNEAMHMGVPPLVSDRVGCQRDLVTPGDTGWVFRHDDGADLKRQLARALETLRDPAASAELRERVKQRISRYTYAHAAAGLEAALQSVTRRA